MEETRQVQYRYHTSTGQSFERLGPTLPGRGDIKVGDWVAKKII